MPVPLSELNEIQGRIKALLKNNRGLAYSSKEIGDEIKIAHSTARKHLKIMYDENIVKRGKQKDYNKTFFYYME